MLAAALDAALQNGKPAQAAPRGAADPRRPQGPGEA